MMLRTSSILLVLFLAAPAPGPAQSLGEIAKREEEKKEKKKKAGKPPATVKVYTEEDLKKARESDAGNLTILPETGAMESGSAASEQPAGRTGGENSTESPATPRDERGWRALASERRQAVKVVESRVQMLEAQIAGLRNDMSPTNVQDPNRLQTQGRELQEAQSNLDAARQELEQARQALANLEDEARRAGALPGWVR